MRDDDILLVDLAGVLFTFEHDVRLPVLGELLGMPPQLVDAMFWASGFTDDCDAGRYPDAAAVRQEIRHRTGYTGTDADLDHAWCSCYAVDPEVLSMLTARQDDLHMVAFTNNGPLEEEVLVRRHPEAFAPFDELLFCHRLSANKPDAAVYREVQQRLDRAAERLLFVDDGEDNVAAARAQGWTAVHFSGPEDLAALLAAGDSGR
ncbi:MAG TPA: HAD-IA family hydrolase [Ornithinimicrobium sp.]|uniref:HAD-IA family hydrolase n=1 Tax=Ornithinimicrobium sp. TaxID=1977084 RepID=UPI002B488D02|nr:HAD-IA family hydrolase [Ornithinimicrobium sp.]HKJ12184.1 HAD-IA family hydrolase [Ornithinimicrobium sp.]